MYITLQSQTRHKINIYFPNGIILITAKPKKITWLTVFKIKTSNLMSEKGFKSKGTVSIKIDHSV